MKPILTGVELVGEGQEAAVLAEIATAPTIVHYDAVFVRAENGNDKANGSFDGNIFVFFSMLALLIRPVRSSCLFSVYSGRGWGLLKKKSLYRLMTTTSVNKANTFDCRARRETPWTANSCRPSPTLRRSKSRRAGSDLRCPAIGDRILPVFGVVYSKYLPTSTYRVVLCFESARYSGWKNSKSEK